MSSSTPDSSAHAPRWLLATAAAYVVALAVALVAYQHSGEVRRFVPDPAGPIPLGVVWWGAMGGVMISLSGIVGHARDFDRTLTAWHLTRPLSGAVVGAVGYLLFVVVIRAAGSTDVAGGEGSAVFYLVAFLLGYREQAFRDLIWRALDLLLVPGGQGASPEPHSTRNGSISKERADHH